MTKNEFMAALRTALSQNKVTNIEDIMADYEEHFSHALAQGKSEMDISKKLGNPETIAKAYETEHMITTIKDPAKPFQLMKALSIFGRLIILAPFNFLVMVIPGSVIIAMLAVGFSCLAAFGSMSFAAILVGFQGQLMTISGWLTLGLVSTSLALAAITVLFGFFMFTITKHILLFFISYLQWNLKFILER